MEPCARCVEQNGRPNETPPHDRQVEVSHRDGEAATYQCRDCGTRMIRDRQSSGSIWEFLAVGG